ncbi:MAG: SDR family NAD(P)-dependent oxidoreductase [Terriglobia bacterium]
MRTLERQNCQVYVEIGPSPVLLGMGRRSVGEGKGEWLASLRKGRGDWEQLLESLGRLYVRGAKVDWAGYDREYRRRKVSLPTYPFQRQRYWIEDRKTGQAASDRSAIIPLQPSKHPLLGSRLDLHSGSGTHTWLSEISLEKYPFLRDHQVQNTVIVPATFYNEMVLEAALELFGEGPLRLTGIENALPILLTETHAQIVQLVLDEEGSGSANFQIVGRPGTSSEKSWKLHVSGRIERFEGIAEQRILFKKETVCQRCPETVSGSEFYKSLAEKGNQWGACFQGVQAVWRTDGEALSRVIFLDSLLGRGYQFHPAWSDSCGHVLTATLSQENSASEKGGAFVGGGIEEVRFYRPPQGGEIWAHAVLRNGGTASNILTGDLQMFDANGLLAEVVGARLWYLEGDEDAAPDRVEKWFVRSTWQPSEEEVQEIKIGKAGPWLILADHNGVGTAVKRYLEGKDRRCVLLDTADGKEPPGWSLASAENWEGAIHLLSLDAPPTSSVDTLNRALELSYVTALRLVQELNKGKKSAKLWLVTRGAQPVGVDDNPETIGTAALWGFGRTLALEHTELWGGLIDLDPNGSPADAALQIGQAVLGTSPEDHLAFRGGRRFVARLMPYRPLIEKAFHCRSNGCYLITGGLGGLGLMVARWLAEKGARRLILMGRTPLPPRSDWKTCSGRQARQIDKIREIESLGTSVHLAAVDVGSETELRHFFEGFEKEGWPPIRGVIHAAGIMQYESISDHTAASMHVVLKPKVTGGWLLHKILSDSPLDFFVLFSSASALLSSPLLASYAAANAFLDELAHWRNAQNLPALSINWGLWAQVGMGADFSETARSTTDLQGVATIAPKKGLEALEQLLLQREAQVGVIPINWVRWGKLYPALANSPYLFDLVGQPNNENSPSAKEDWSSLRLSTDPAQQRKAVQSYLAKQVAAVLGLDVVTLQINEPITNFGLDSLMAVELKNRIELDLGLVVPMVKFLQGPSIESLTSQLTEELAMKPSSNFQQGSPKTVDVTMADAEQLLTRLPELSDDQVNDLLTAMLSKDRDRP